MVETRSGITGDDEHPFIEKARMTELIGIEVIRKEKISGVERKGRCVWEWDVLKLRLLWR